MYIHIATAWYVIAALALAWVLVRKYQPDLLLSQTRKRTIAPVLVTASTSAVPIAPQRSIPWGVVGLIFVLLILTGAAVLLWRPVIGYVQSPAYQSRWQPAPVASPAAMQTKTIVQASQTPTCAEFVFKEHRKCTFGDTIQWISTGQDGGALCVNHMPSGDADFIVYNADGTSLGNSPSVQAEQGFKAPQGQTREVEYWKAPSPDDCAKS